MSIDLVIAYTAEQDGKVSEAATELVKRHPTAMVVVVGGGSEADIVAGMDLPADVILMIQQTRGIIDALIRVTNQLIVPLRLKRVALVCPKPYEKVGTDVLRYISCCGVSSYTVDKVLAVGEPDPTHAPSSLEQRAFSTQLKHIRTLRDMVLWLNFEHRPAVKTSK